MTVSNICSTRRVVSLDFVVPVWYTIVRPCDRTTVRLADVSGGFSHGRCGRFRRGTGIPWRGLCSKPNFQGAVGAGAPPGPAAGRGGAGPCGAGRPGRPAPRGGARGGPGRPPPAGGGAPAGRVPGG